jgi:glycosyltransferase involved in cell wall biosynthesis
MHLAVFSHKVCWPSQSSGSGYATDGGFPFQMQSISELFEKTTLIVPCMKIADRSGEVELTGHNLSVVPLTVPLGRGILRKLTLPLWLLANSYSIIREACLADAIHAPIPGDIGTLGLLIAVLLRKRLFVRHCGNWFVQRTTAERFWKWFMERFAGGRNVVLATGGGDQPPSNRNHAIRWVFSTSLTERDLEECSRRRVIDNCGPIRLITVCRQEWGKGTELVIRSLPLILDALPNTTLDIVGDGAGLEDFKRIAESLGLEGRIQFHGKVSHKQVVDLLQSADLFCYPTASEGFPKAVLEALACGLPVVTTRVSVLPYLIGSGGGILLDEATPACLAQAVLECINNPREYRRMSLLAAKVARQYSLERWKELLGETLGTAWGRLRPDA